MAIFDLKNAVITILDGTPTTPLNITAKIGEGNITFSEKRNIEYRLDRGLLDTTRLGDQVPMDVKIDANWIFLKGDSADTPTTTIRDALTKTGGAAAWLTSGADACAPYAVDIKIVYTPCAGKTETILLHEFRYESIDADAKAGTLSVSGKCNAQTPTLTRT